MQTLKIGILIMLTALLTAFIIIMACALPHEGKVVDYRLEHSSGSEIGYYPVIRVVVEDGLDYYMYFPNKTMDEGVQIMNDLKKSIPR